MRKHAITLTLILASFISICSSCLWSSKGLQVVHNCGHGYSNSSFTLQGCTSTHTLHQLPPVDGPFKWVPERMLPRHFTHDTISVPRESLFELGPQSESGRFFRCGLKRCVTAIKLNSIMITWFNVPTTYVHHLPWFTCLRSLKFELLATPGSGPGWGTRTRGVSEPNVWSYS